MSRRRHSREERLLRRRRREKGLPLGGGGSPIRNPNIITTSLPPQPISPPQPCPSQPCPPPYLESDDLSFELKSGDQKSTSIPTPDNNLSSDLEVGDRLFPLITAGNNISCGGPIRDPNTITTSLPSPPNNLILSFSPTLHRQSDDRSSELESGDQPFTSIPALDNNPSSDLEVGNQASNNIDTDLPEWKRIGKFVQTVAFGGFGVLISLFVSTPGLTTTHRALYIAYFTSVCLGLASSLCLSAYSIMKKGSPAVGLVQKHLIYFTFFFLVLACFFRLQIELPSSDLGFVMVPTLIGMLGIYLFLSSRYQTYGTDAILFPAQRNFTLE